VTQDQLEVARAIPHPNSRWFPDNAAKDDLLLVEEIIDGWAAGNPASVVDDPPDNVFTEQAQTLIAIKVYELAGVHCLPPFSPDTHAQLGHRKCRKAGSRVSRRPPSVMRLPGVWGAELVIHGRDLRHRWM
jgi:hypothetical protein